MSSAVRVLDVAGAVVLVSADFDAVVTTFCWRRLSSSEVSGGGVAPAVRAAQISARPRK
jgi:hypothetical protein